MLHPPVLLIEPTTALICPLTSLWPITTQQWAAVKRKRELKIEAAHWWKWGGPLNWIDTACGNCPSLASCPFIVRGSYKCLAVVADSVTKKIKRTDFMFVIELNELLCSSIRLYSGQFIANVFRCSKLLEPSTRWTFYLENDNWLDQYDMLINEWIVLFESFRFVFKYFWGALKYLPVLIIYKWLTQIDIKNSIF